MVQRACCERLELSRAHMQLNFVCWVATLWEKGFSVVNIIWKLILSNPGRMFVPYYICCGL